MFLHRCQYTQVALYSPGIVVTDVVGNHLGEFLPAGESPTVISLSLQNAPKAFHWAIVYAVGHPGHALAHTCLHEFVVEYSAGVLITSIAMKKRVRLWISTNGLVKGLIDKGIIVAVTHHIGNNSSVIKVQDGTQIELMYLNAFIPFELSYIGKPFLVRLFCIELAVQEVVGKILWVFGLPGAAMVIIFHGGPNISGSTDTKHSFVVNMNPVVVR